MYEGPLLLKLMDHFLSLLVFVSQSHNGAARKVNIQQIIVTEYTPHLSFVPPLCFAGIHTMSHLWKEGTLFQKNKYSSPIPPNVPSSSLQPKKKVRFHNG